MKAITRSLLVLVIAAGVAVAGCASTSGGLETVPAQEASDRIAETPGVVVLDIRTPQELQEGVIDGAVNIDFYEPDFAAQLELLDKDAPYVVYCRSGNRSAQAMELFSDLGFSDVTEIDGGIVQWTAEGFPLSNG